MTQLNKILRNLESKKLIKAVKSVSVSALPGKYVLVNAARSDACIQSVRATVRWKFP